MRRLLLVLVPLALVGVRAAPALAWAATGHRLIGEAAAESLPDEVPAFLRTPDTVWRLGELSREPDRVRAAGQPHDADLDPGHFLDLDDQGKMLGGPTLAELPPNREAFEKALQAAGTDSWKAGWLPYSIIDGYEQLVKDFAYWRVDRVGEAHGMTPEDRAWFAKDRALREAIIVHDLGEWSHYVGDGSQPLHLTYHYNGWGNFPNPNNYTRERIHEPFEGAYVHDNITEAMVKAAMKPYRPCGCTIREATASYLGQTAALVEPLYRMWGDGDFKGTDPRGKPFVTERLAAAATEVRDLVVEAWRASENGTVGYPAVSARSVEQSGVAPLVDVYGDD